MRKSIIWACLVVFTALVEETWLGLARIQGVLPDLILLLVVYFAIVSGQERAMFTGALGGAFQDVAADTGLGHHALCLVVTGFLVGRVAQRLITDHPAVKVSIVFCAGLAQGLLYTAVDYVQNPDMNALYTVLVSVVPRAFYTALATPLIFLALDRSVQFEDSLRGAG